MTFSLDLFTSMGRSSVGVGRLGFGFWLAEAAGETESLEGGRDEVEEEGVTGRAAVGLV